MRLKEAFNITADDEGQGVYISLGVKSSSAERIVESLSALLGGDMLDKDDMHVTMMYDEEGEVPRGFIMRDGIMEYSGEYGVELFGDEKNVLVLTLETPSEIDKRHNRLSAYGLNHSYKDFRPHITLSYDFSTENKASNILEIIKEAANQRIGKIQLSGERISRVVKNWADDKK